MFNPVLAVGQVHAFHMLFRQNPVLAIIVLVLLIALALYFKNHQ